MFSSVLLGVLLALPVLAAAAVALLGSRHGMLGLFGAHHELAEVVGSHEVADSLLARPSAARPTPSAGSPSSPPSSSWP